MNTRTSTILIAGALIAAASTLSAQAADQDPTAREAKPATLHQAQESDWFARERALGSGTFAPVPFPVRPAAPVVAAKSRPAPTSQTADNNWWTQEQALDDGHVWPIPSASNARTAPYPTDASR
jgi:hypothetical protein